jgi:NADPH2:quinone reductase
MTPAPGSVRAARLTEHGQPLVVEEIELSDPGEDEVRVDLLYGGVNPIDRYTAEGRVAPDGPLPRTLGGEASGMVDEGLVLVSGAGLGSTRDGVWAQAANVPREAVLSIPGGVQPPAAAAMGIAGLTAISCVRDLARVGKEDRVLVLGASGGVGSMIVSLAAAAGAMVWGQTGSEAKAGLIAEQGASKAVVAGPEELEDQLADLEPTVVFDPLGDGFAAPAIEALTARGRYVCFGTSAGPEVTFNLQTLYRKMIALLGYGGMQLSADERRHGLQAALKAVADDELKVRIDSVLPLDQANEALERIAERKVHGNLLLDLR